MTNEYSEALTQQYKKDVTDLKKKAEQISLNVDASEDYERSRQTLHNLIERADEALETLLNLAHDSEHPRTFEVLAGLIKTSSDLTERLMNLQKDREELNQNKEAKKDGGGTTHNNTLFVGSTAELQKFLKGEKDAEAEIIE